MLSNEVTLEDEPPLQAVRTGYQTSQKFVKPQLEGIHGQSLSKQKNKVVHNVELMQIPSAGKPQF